MSKLKLYIIDLERQGLISSRPLPRGTPEERMARGLPVHPMQQVRGSPCLSYPRPSHHLRPRSPACHALDVTVNSAAVTG